MTFKKSLVALALSVSSVFMFASVIQAQATQNIVELAQATPSLSTLVTAVVEADLVGALSDADASFTVFAPVNSAFDALPAGTLDQLLSEEGLEDLTSILTLHVVDSKVMSSELSNGQMITTLNGERLRVSIEGGNVYIAGARVTTADVEATNGVVHIIDTVILPGTGSQTHAMANTGIEQFALGAMLVAVTLAATSAAGVLAFQYKRR